jgi:aminoglycoside phosphotransferase (APT) family kinase protein
MIRLGDMLSVRLPRTREASASLGKEQQFLPSLAAQLPVKIPLPVAFGEPDCGYPSRWSVCAWLPGRNPEPGEADTTLASDIAAFVRALHAIDTLGLRSEGLLHSYRAGSIQARDAITRNSIDQCNGLFDPRELMRIWTYAKCVEEFTAPPVWTHADLHPGNLLVHEGRLAAVLDWGSLILGDPAIDCMVAWSLLTPATRSTFRARIGADEATWNRGRAWGLSIALVALPYYLHTNQQMLAWAQYAIRQIVDDVSGSVGF